MRRGRELADDRRTLRSPATALLAILLCALSSCVSGEHREARDARAALDRCVRERSEDDPECEVLRARHRKVQERYLETSRRAWGCGPEPGECPTPR